MGKDLSRKAFSLLYSFMLWLSLIIVTDGEVIFGQENSEQRSDLLPYRNGIASLFSGSLSASRLMGTKPGWMSGLAIYHSLTNQSQ
jgi:hypothetical protein